MPIPFRRRERISPDFIAVPAEQAGRTNPYRHPLGRTCRDPRRLLFVLVAMPYALARYGLDCLRGNS